jgi:hypothetical protein
MLKNVVLSICLLFLTHLMFAQAPNNMITERIIPAEYQEPYRFLETIKWDSLGHGGYQEKNAPFWNVDSVAAYLSSSGVNCIDPNLNFDMNLPKDTIANQLRNRTGMGFNVIAHLSFIYSIPYKQYSELSFETTTSVSVVVHIANIYKLTFIKVRSHYYLSACEYLVIERN